MNSSSIFSAALLSLIIITGESGKRRLYKRFVAEYDLDIRLTVGTPPETIFAKLDTQTSKLIVMDAACLDDYRSPYCGLLCRSKHPFFGDEVDEKLLIGYQRLFCNPLCEKVEKEKRKLRCPATEPKYSAKRSRSYRDGGAQVFLNFGSLRQFYGERALDRLELTTRHIKRLRPPKFESYIAPVTGVVEFARGLAFDPKYFKVFTTAAVGLAPTANRTSPSILSQFQLRGQLSASQVSIQRYRQTRLLTQITPTGYVMIFGSLDKWSCTNWRFLKAEPTEDWSFKMENAKFMGKDLPGPNYGRILLTDTTLQIPKAIADPLLKAGVFEERMGTFKLLILKVGDPSTVRLEFSVGGERIVLGKDLLVLGGRTTRMMNLNQTFLFTDEPQWAFGGKLLETLCFGYDYDLGAVAWGQRKGSSWLY